MNSLCEKVARKDVEKSLEEIRGAVGKDKAAYGCYKVMVERMEYRESKEGEPILFICFKIAEGEFRDKMIFYSKLLTHGYWIHQACELMRSFESGLDIEFEEFNQFNQIIKQVFIVMENKEIILKYYEEPLRVEGYDIEII